MKSGFLSICLMISLFALEESSTIPISKTYFRVTQQSKSHEVDLSGKDFIVISLRQANSDGRFYAVDSDGTVWWSGEITSGAMADSTLEGIFSILQKERYYMSKEYPDVNGINNMDYMLKFTNQGHALHQGSVTTMSHGCIHLALHDIVPIFNWANKKTYIVITRSSYMPFAQEDLQRIYLRE